jgi:streptogramin lyase
MLPRTATRALALTAFLLALFVVPAAAAPTVSGEFAVEGISANDKLIQGPDGNMWVTTASGTKDVARITPSGQVTEYDLEAANPTGIAVADGKLWITRTGGVTSFEAKDPEGTKEATAIAGIAGTDPIVRGPDGNLWVGAGETLVRISPANPSENKPFTVTGLDPKDIDVAGSLLAIANFGSESVVTATATDPPVTNEVKVGGGSQGVAGGPSGQIAYTQPTNEPKEVGLFTPPTLTPLKKQVPGTDPFGIVLGQDGAYWAAEGNGDRLLRITTSGEVSDLKGFATGSRPTQIATGPGGTLWVTLSLAGKVGRVSGVEAPVPPGLPGPGGSGSPAGGDQPHPAPETEITSGPGKRIATAGKKLRVTFRFASPQASSAFECRLVRPAKKKPKRHGKAKGKAKHKGKAKASAVAAPPPFRPCSSPQRYKLGPGRYSFEVRAVLAGVADTTPAKRSFAVVFSP